MTVIFTGIFAAFIMIFRLLPDSVSFLDAAHIAGKMGKLNTIDFSFNLSDRYTFWSGLIGGTFLMLSYFGTDQSQVQRYLAGSSITQSRMGLLLNGLVKVPMQFFILYIGVMVFVFFQFTVPPLFFNPEETENIKNSVYAEDYARLEENYTHIHQIKETSIHQMLEALDNEDPQGVLREKSALLEAQSEAELIREEAISLIKKNNPQSDGNDVNYIFLSFVLAFLPAGLIGMVLAAILSASMSSTAAELNALASTTVIDIYRRLIKKDGDEKHYLLASKIATIFWGFIAIFFALFANRLGSLIEAVNILGSLFYGTILGIFLVAFYLKKVGGNAVFISAIISEFVVLGLFIFSDIPYLWFNVIGCVLVIIISLIIGNMFGYRKLK